MSARLEVLFREDVTVGGDTFSCVVKVVRDDHGLMLKIVGAGPTPMPTARGTVGAEAVEAAVVRAVAFMHQAVARDDETTAGGAR